MVVPPALHAIYEDDHPFIVIRKPAQVGITEFNINTALFTADTGYAGRGVALVILPTGEMAERISQARFAKAINESPYLRQRSRPERGPIRTPANVNRRAIGEGVVYFVGAEQETQFSGIDADVVICDEFDLMKEGILSLIQSRIRSSSAGKVLVTSTPTVESFGVSALYENSDARRYELCCQCGTWQTPDFPDSIDWDRLAVVCRPCRAVLDPYARGRWVADKPTETAIRGYQLSRLVLPDPPLAAMRFAMEGKLPTTKEDFYRQDLGLPWVSEDARLTPDDLERAKAELRFDRTILQCREVVMGVDVGNHLHVVIRGRYQDHWYLLLATTCAEFGELDALMVQHNVGQCVIDALPESRAARDFFERHMSEVHLCTYGGEGIAPHWAWSDGVATVRVSRTLAMNDWLHSFKSGLFKVPEDYRQLADGEYVKHLLAPVRVTKLDEFGQPVATFQHTRPDDFAHAEVYARLATTRLSQGGVLLLDAKTMSAWRPNSPSHPDLEFRPSVL